MSGGLDSTLAPVPVGGGYAQFIATMNGNPLLHPLGVYQGSSGFLPGYSSLAGFLAANPGWVVPYYEYGATPSAPVPINSAPGIFKGPTDTMFPLGPGADADYVVRRWLTSRGKSQGMTLVPAVIPERTIVLLAGLCALLLMMFRQRN